MKSVFPSLPFLWMGDVLVSKLRVETEVMKGLYFLRRNSNNDETVTIKKSSLQHRNLNQA